MTAETENKPSEGLIPPYVLPSWYEAYKYSNQHYPKTTFGISTYVSREIINSLLDGVDLNYAMRSRLSPEQFADIIKATIKAHRANNISKIPGQAGKEGRKTFDPDFWFNGTWTDLKKYTLKGIAYLAASKNPGYMTDEERFKTRINQLAYNVAGSNYDPANVYAQDDILEFSKSPEYKRILLIVRNLYKTTHDTLETGEVRELSRERRKLIAQRGFADSIDSDINPADIEWKILRLLKGPLINSVREQGIPEDKAQLFLSTLTGYPTYILKDYLYWHTIE